MVIFFFFLLFIQQCLLGWRRWGGELRRSCPPQARLRRWRLRSRFWPGCLCLWVRSTSCWGQRSCCRRTPPAAANRRSVRLLSLIRNTVSKISYWLCSLITFYILDSEQSSVEQSNLMRFLHIVLMVYAACLQGKYRFIQVISPGRVLFRLTVQFSPKTWTACELWRLLLSVCVSIWSWDFQLDRNQPSNWLYLNISFSRNFI